MTNVEKMINTLKASAPATLSETDTSENDGMPSDEVIVAEAVVGSGTLNIYSSEAPPFDTDTASLFSGTVYDSGRL